MSFTSGRDYQPSDLQSVLSKLQQWCVFEGGTLEGVTVYNDAIAVCAWILVCTGPHRQQPPFQQCRDNCRAFKRWMQMRRAQGVCLIQRCGTNKPEYVIETVLPRPASLVCFTPAPLHGAV